MPDPSSRRSKSDKLAFDQVDVAHWADIYKVFETDVAEPQSLNLERYSLGLLRAVQSYKRVLKACFVNFLLSLFLVANKLNALCLLQEVMVEIALEHEVVVVDLLELLHQVLLADDQLDHFLSDGLSDLLDDTLKDNLAVLLLEDNFDIN
jgi:hypothetical protein